MGLPPRPYTKAVHAMMTLQQIMMSQMYVEERLAQAERDYLLDTVERAQRRRSGTLKTRVGRTLVRVGRRLEAAPA